MKKLPIIMNAADHEELRCVLAAAGRLNERARAEISGLRSELNRADIVAPDAVPSDVITMNSRAELVDLDTNERMEFTVVFPAEADVEEGKISVLAPLGTAMLGYRVGNEFEWVVPYGRRRLKVAAVRFQPEAAGATADANGHEAGASLAEIGLTNYPLQIAGRRSKIRILTGS
jgi:regulator of nucleoside diphosphate kinase